MNAMNTTETPWPLGLYFLLVLLLVAVVLLISAVLGQRHKEPATGEIYESGIVSTGSVRMHYHANFYLMAMFFVVFDLEAVFLYAYAAAFPRLGWAAFAEVAVFIAILGASLFYLWRIGALDWGVKPQPGKTGSEP